MSAHKLSLKKGQKAEEEEEEEILMSSYASWWHWIPQLVDLRERREQVGAASLDFSISFLSYIGYSLAIGFGFLLLLNIISAVPMSVMADKLSGKLQGSL